MIIKSQKRHTCEHIGVSDRARRMFIHERSSGARPLAEEGERVSGGEEDSGARPSRGIDRIKLDLSEINTKEERRARTLLGEVVEIRGHAGETSNEIYKTWTFPVYLYLKQKKGPRWIFFGATGDTKPH